MKCVYCVILILINPHEPFWYFFSLFLDDAKCYGQWLGLEMGFVLWRAEHFDKRFFSMAEQGSSGCVKAAGD